MRIALGLALLSAACIYACGSSSSSPKGGSAGADIGAAGDSSSSGGKANGSAGKGDTGGDSGANGIGDSGAGGDNGVPIVVISTAKPHAAGGIVAGGLIAHSKHFTGVFSLGAGPGGNRIMTSSSYQLRGGVLGASQK
jgi:hypothetical protein